MRMTFFEKRRQLREPVTDGTARVAGETVRIVNWSQNGLLLDGMAGPVAAGQRFSAEIDLTAVGGERFAFAAEARVARLHGAGRVAATYVCLDGQVAPRIVRHFHPIPGHGMKVLADAATAREQAARDQTAPDPEPPPSAAPAAAGDPVDDSVRLADMVVAAREVALLKTAFARRFHPDTAPRDDTHALRVEMFKEFWDVLDAAEKRLRGVK